VLGTKNEGKKRGTTRWGTKNKRGERRAGEGGGGGAETGERLRGGVGGAWSMGGNNWEKRGQGNGGGRREKWDTKHFMRSNDDPFPMLN